MLFEEIRFGIARTCAVLVHFLHILEHVGEDFFFFPLNVQLSVDGFVFDLDFVKLRSRAVELGEVDVHLEFQLIAPAVETRHCFRNSSSCRVKIELQARNVQAETDIQLVDFLSSCHLHHIVNENFLSILLDFNHCNKLI